MSKICQRFKVVPMGGHLVLQVEKRGLVNIEGRNVSDIRVSVVILEQRKMAEMWKADGVAVDTSHIDYGEALHAFRSTGELVPSPFFCRKPPCW